MLNKHFSFKVVLIFTFLSLHIFVIAPFFLSNVDNDIKRYEFLFNYMVQNEAAIGLNNNLFTYLLYAVSKSLSVNDFKEVILGFFTLSNFILISVIFNKANYLTQKVILYCVLSLSVPVLTLSYSNIRSLCAIIITIIALLSEHRARKYLLIAMSVVIHQSVLILWIIYFTTYILSKKIKYGNILFFKSYTSRIGLVMCFALVIIPVLSVIHPLPPWQSGILFTLVYFLCGTLCMIYIPTLMHSKFGYFAIASLIMGFAAFVFNYNATRFLSYFLIFLLVFMTRECNERRYMDLVILLFLPVNAYGHYIFLGNNL